jgi:hypothetical protein
MYDMTWPDCLRAIDPAIAALRAAGARRIILADMSQVVTPRSSTAPGIPSCWCDHAGPG